MPNRARIVVIVAKPSSAEEKGRRLVRQTDLFILDGHKVDGEQAIDQT